MNPKHLTLQNMIAWLKKQDPKKEYSYISPGNCMLAQYFTAMGYENVTVNCYEIRYTVNGKGKKTPNPTSFEEIAVRYDSVLYRRTFGGALKRAERVLEGKSSYVLLQE